VTIIPTEAVVDHREEAFEAVKLIDPDDVIFVACIMAYPNSILWSEDKRLNN